MSQGPTFEDLKPLADQVGAALRLQNETAVQVERLMKVVETLIDRVAALEQELADLSED